MQQVNSQPRGERRRVYIRSKWDLSTAAEVSQAMADLADLWATAVDSRDKLTATWGGLKR